MRNADVIVMTRLALPVAAIVSAVNRVAAEFDTTPSALKALEASGVAPEVVAAMRRRTTASVSVSTPASTVTPPASGSKTFEFPAFGGTRVLHVAPNALRYETQTSTGRSTGDAVAATCGDIEWKRGRFNGSIRITFRNGREQEFRASPTRLDEVVAALQDACGRSR